MKRSNEMSTLVPIINETSCKVSTTKVYLYSLYLLGHSKLINSSCDSLAPRIVGPKFQKNSLHFSHFFEMFIVIPKLNFAKTKMKKIKVKKLKCCFRINF